MSSPYEVTDTAPPPPLALPPSIAESPWYRVKCALLGRPLITARLRHERLSSPVALGVLSPDCISSSAYGPEEMLIELLPYFGMLAFVLVLPVTGAILFVLLVATLTYRDVVTVYTRSGGSYVVARENFGPKTAQIAAAALLIDYVVTVAVQCSAGTVAVVSAIPVLGPYSLWITVGVVLLITYGNLRGIREAGRSFALPTYLFFFFMMIMIVVGIARFISGNLGHVDLRHIPGAIAIGEAHPTFTSAFAVLVLLRAFANGGSSLTGLEAISNGISVFRSPEAVHARRTLVAMALMLGTLVAGVSFLAFATHVPPRASGYPSVVAQEAQVVFGSHAIGHALFICLQTASAMILYTGGNTSFNGFPFLASFVADDAFLPRWLTKRGHRLAYSNGILVLSISSIALLIVTNAKVNSLIPFYAIGVFTAFTMAGAGMARYRWRQHDRVSRRKAVVHTLTAITCACVVLIFAIVKFTEGAWLVVIAFPLLVWLLIRINERQKAERSAIAAVDPNLVTEVRHYPRHYVYVFVDQLDLPTLAALRYGASLRPTEITAIHIAIDAEHARMLQREWSAMLHRVPLEVVECPDRRLERTTAQLVTRATSQPGTHVTVVLPRRRFGRLGQLMHDRTADRLAAVASRIPGAVATIIPYDVLPNRAVRRQDKKTTQAAVDEFARPRDRQEHITPIAQLRWRRQATVEGRITSLETQPLGATPTLRCELYDDTGGIQLLFLGRRNVAGVETGRRLRATGTVTSYEGALAIFNPIYELLPDE